MVERFVKVRLSRFRCYIIYMVVFLEMSKNDKFCEGTWIFIVYSHGNHFDKSFMFQRIFLLQE